MNIFYIIFIEIKTDLIKCYTLLLNNIILFNNKSTFKKLIYICLFFSTILIIYFYIKFIFYILKYTLKYIFILLDFILKKFNEKLYINKYYINMYINTYTFLKIIYAFLFNKLFDYLYTWGNLIRKGFYINYIIKHKFKIIKKTIDKKMYNIYNNIENLFKFSFINDWKNDIKNIYLPKIKKNYKIMNIIILDKTIKLRKLTYLYILYLKNIMRTIFWLYIFKIYLDLILTSFYSYIYFIIIIMPINIYLLIKYNIKRLYTFLIINFEELNHVKNIYIKFFFLFTLIFIKIWIYIFFLIVFILGYLILKYFFEYLFSFLLFYIKVCFFHWKYYFFLLQYKGSRLWLDLIFQCYTLFLSIYLHSIWDINLNFYFFKYAIMGNFKYFYFNYTHYKFFIFLAIINIIY